MIADKKPWLFLKRVSTWNPLANVRELAAPPAYAPEAATADEVPSAKRIRARWGFIGPIP